MGSAYRDEIEKDMAARAVKKFKSDPFETISPWSTTSGANKVEKLALLRNPISFASRPSSQSPKSGKPQLWSLARGARNESALKLPKRFVRTMRSQDQR